MKHNFPAYSFMFEFSNVDSGTLNDQSEHNFELSNVRIFESVNVRTFENLQIASYAYSGMRPYVRSDTKISDQTSRIEDVITDQRSQIFFLT